MQAATTPTMGPGLLYDVRKKMEYAAYTIQFAKQILLFTVKEACLKNEFPCIDILTVPNLIVHINAPLFYNITNLVTAVNITDKEKERIILPTQPTP